MKTPKPGIYVIDAHDVNSNVLKDDGEMAVFGADFVEDGGHIYGFDDYTGWDAGAAGYYSTPKTGRCVWPYASVQVNQWGCSELNIKSWGVNRTFDIECDRDGVSYYPETTVGTARVDFFAGVQWYNETGNATLTANYDGVNLAQLKVVPLRPKTRSVLLVYVDTAGAVQGAGILNDVYKQCVTSFVTIQGNFPYVAPVNGVWDDSACDAVKAAIMSDINLNASDYDHVVAILDGRHLTNHRGMTTIRGKFIWIWPSAGCQYTLAHEIGHNLGLSDVYLKNPPRQGPDKDNLMNLCLCDPNHSCTRKGVLRYNQWKEVN